MKNIGVILFLLLLSGTLAAKSTQTQNLKQQRKALQTEIEKNNQLIAENNRSIKLSLNRLNLIIEQIEMRKKLLLILEEEITNINGEIRLNEHAVEKLEQNLQTKKEQYMTAVRQLYKQKNKPDQWLFVLSADNPSQAFRRMLYLKEYSNWRHNQAGEIIAQQQELNAKKEILLSVKNENQTILELKRQEENQLQTEEKKHQTQVDQLKKNSKQLKAEIDKKKKQAAALDREIARIIKAEIEKSAKAAKAAKKDTKTESKGGFALTREEQALAASFGANKGKIPFPLKGNYRIVNRFGEHQYGNLRQTKTDNNGIDIQTSAGNTAKVVFEGVVMDVFRVPGEQLSVLVRHGSYITLYSNLSQILVKKGDTVKTNQEIGRIYTDPSAGTILHFELWKEKTRLNPESWLNK
ncbi:MAG: peptidoglycan DD-metalloendopeptidase family protein [Candidatus Symbiothrix sp.]|jgi:septal ring factor EnvC (AmiA/AmiB activator)|nr:peptidoglycan DD-metalloendopeptidase family protein [Candidatus Symbiothrix sp.]